jgi:NAD(P)-dependent dehydrogenase (short-subunit alcohol dehydrogenase family)
MKIDGVVAVTGAGGGLGLGFITEAARRGYRCLALILDESQRADVATATAGLSGAVEIQILDVTKPGDFAFPADLDVLVNNAGIRLKNLPIEHLPLDEWRLYMEINFFGAVELTKRAIPVMRARGKGLIVNINSGSLYSPIPFLGPYRATKGAMMAFTETLRCEVEQFGIGVLEILPGAVRTGINKESVTVRVAHAVEYPDYAPMAERQHAMYKDTDFRIWEIEDAAKFIVDAMEDNGDRMRHGSDPGSDASAVSGWRPNGGEQQIAPFIARLTPEKTT